MSGGRKIIAIEGGAEDGALKAAAIRLGKLPSGDALLEEGNASAEGEDAGDSSWLLSAPADESVATWDEDEGEAPRIQREWLGIAVGGALIAAWSVAFIMGNLAAFQHLQPLGVWTGLVSAWSAPVLVVLVSLLVLRRNSRREAASSAALICSKSLRASSSSSEAVPVASSNVWSGR